MVRKPQKKGATESLDLAHQVVHYAELFWRKKWFIGIAAPLITLLALVIILVAASRKKELPALALIGIENVSDMTAVRDVSGLVQAQSDLIKSRIFLEEVVKKHSFRLLVKKYDRATVFDSILVDSTALNGNYYLKIDKSDRTKYSILFREQQDNGIPLVQKFLQKPLTIFTGTLPNLRALDLPGIHLVFSSRFVNMPMDIAFDVIHIRDDVELIYNNLSVKAADPSRGSFNIAISVASKDYSLSAEITNAISDAFVEKNISLKKGRSQSVLVSLEKQLETTKRDLVVSENSLNAFRSQYPSVGLSDNIKLRISSLSQLETGAIDEKRSVTNAQDLLSQFINASDEESKLRVAGESLVFLVAHKVTAAPVLQNELNDLLASRREIEQTYSEDHPVRVDFKKKFDTVLKDVLANLQTYIGSVQSSIDSKSSNIQSLSGELRNLPGKELQLAELQRMQQISSDIYSTVLSRYNQAKVSNSAEVPEAFVMDYAMPPIPAPTSTSKLVLLALFLGIVAAFIPVIFMDYLDKTVLTSFDFARKTGKTFFEVVPKIPQIKRKISKNDKKENPSTEEIVPLVTEYLPNTYVHEVFRILRTKLTMMLTDQSHKIVCVTSMETSAGKSTISANIACILARQNIPVIIIDADMRRGELHATFGCKKSAGLTEFLQANTALDIETYIQQTKVSNLSIITSGDGAQNSSELLSSVRFADLLKVLEQKFAYIIIDSPPIGAITDAAVIASLVSKYLVIVKAGVTNVNDLIAKLSEFPVIEERLLGYILNFSTEKKAVSYYKNSKYNT